MNILSASAQRPVYGDTLHENMRTVHEISLSALSRYESFSQYDLVIIEADEDYTFLQEFHFSLFSSRCIIAGDLCNNELKSMVRKAGFVRFVKPEDIPPVVAAYEQGVDLVQDALSLLLFDENPVHQSVMKQIAEDFGHSILIKEDFDSFYSSLSRNYDFLLINVHTKACDMPVFARKVFNVTNFRKACVLPFLEKEHCEIADIYSGLNRIAKVVLNLEELIHFLINSFYKRELESQRMMLNMDAEELCGDKIPYSVKPTVLFGEHGIDYILSKPEIESEKLLKLNNRTKSIEALNGIVLPYLWLMHSHEGATCGPDV